MQVYKIAQNPYTAEYNILSFLVVKELKNSYRIKVLSKEDKKEGHNVEVKKSGDGGYFLSPDLAKESFIKQQEHNILREKSTIIRAEIRIEDTQLLIKEISEL